MSIEIRHLTHHFGAEPVLQDISLSVADGEMVALLGPSGSGKTTLLRIIAGLTPHSAGELYISGEEVSGWRQGAPGRVCFSALCTVPAYDGV